MGMIQQIINDAKAMEAEVIRSEEDAQKAYEEFVKDTNGSIDAKSKDIVNKSESKATAEGDRVEAKEDLTAKIEDLDSTIEQLTKAIDTLKSEVSEMQVQMKRAGEDREKENKEFQGTVADQRATQKLLTAALNILKGFYAGLSLRGGGENQFHFDITNKKKIVVLTRRPAPSE